MLERLFKSKTTIKLLELLLFEQPLHLREIARRINVTPIYVKKELENLELIGLTINRRIGNLKIWEINRKSPIYEDIKKIFLKTESLGRYLQKIFKKFNIHFALIYGSFAKGIEKEKSDVDILIIGKLNEDEFMKVIDKIEKNLYREIEYIIWSEDEFIKNAEKKHPLLTNIIKNPIIWLKGDENEFRKFIKRGSD